MEHAPGTAHNEGDSDRTSVTAMVPLPRNASSFIRVFSRSTSAARRMKHDAVLGKGTIAEERVVLHPRVQPLHLRDQAAHFVDGVIAALRGAGVTRPASKVKFHLHAAALPAIDAQLARFGDHHAIGAYAVFPQNVEPAQAVAVFFLHRAHHPKRVVAKQAELLDHLDGVNHARHAGALVARSAPVDVAILHLALVRIPGPFLGIAHAHRVGVRVHHDGGFARADAAQDVPHGVDAHLVETHLLHFLANAGHHRALVPAFRRNGDEVAQETHHVAFVRLGQLRQAMAVRNFKRRCGHSVTNSSSRFAGRSAWSARSTSSGRKGSFRMRTPTAWKMALAIAGAGPLMGTSEMDFAPYGPNGSSVSTRMVVSFGMSCAPNIL